MFAIGLFGITELIIIIVLLLVFVPPVAVVVGIIWLARKSSKRSNPASAHESRVEYLERQSEPSSSKTRD